MRWLTLLVLSCCGCQTLLWPSPRLEESTAIETADTDDLALAAKCLERGDEAGAVPHLMSLVRANPEQVMFRAQLAELFYRLDRDDEARDHFERFIASAQSTTGPAHNHIVHCHTRLMQLADRRDDHAEEQFHKGVGLLLLAKESESHPEFDESVLCQAAKLLQEAKDLRPDDARVSLYLGDAYQQMGQSARASREWKAAREKAVPGLLSPMEERHLRESLVER